MDEQTASTDSEVMTHRGPVLGQRASCPPLTTQRYRYPRRGAPTVGSLIRRYQSLLKVSVRRCDLVSLAIFSIFSLGIILKLTCLHDFAYRYIFPIIPISTIGRLYIIEFRQYNRSCPCDFEKQLRPAASSIKYSIIVSSHCHGGVGRLLGDIPPAYISDRI